ncbi:MAG: hypothetical protein QG637_1485 [Chloroflexota bacterium]|nr:hypothetical protein [Chloroflexota bacterium]
MTGSANPDPFALTASNRALLTVALSPDAEKAAAAWRAWRAATDLDALPAGQYLMLPALYANLARFGLADEADPRIKGVYRRAWYANRRLVELAAAALTALGGAGIPAALGGAAAVQELYAGPGERPIGQSELLVAPADVTSAAATLVGAGWRPVRALDLLADPGYRQWAHQAMFRRDRAEVQRLADVELLSLAWRPLPAAPAPGDAARFGALALDTGAAPPRLRREAQLILACARAVEGSPSRLIALADACVILRTPLDWGLVVDLAGLLAAARPLAAVLPAVEEVLGVGRLEVAATVAKSAYADSPDGQPAQAGFAEVAAVSNRRGEDQGELPHERLDDARGRAGRVRFHLRRWRRIARGQGAALTPLSLLRYLQAAAGVARLRQLPRRLWQAAIRRKNANHHRANR